MTYNRESCRRHCWVAGDPRCILCGVGDPHKHCYGEWHVCAWLLPLEHDRERVEGR